jgi:hypothetical protein
MPVNQIIDGTFQDIQANPLANGYLLFQLNQDGTTSDSSGDTLVCSQYTIKVPLDSNGNVVTSPTYSLWPNSLLSPSGSFYTVSAYSAKGQLVWGPFSQIIPTSPSPFNIGTWTPGKAS